MTKLCLFLSMTFLLIQCKSKDYLTPYEYEGRVIDFGSGGGFTGKVKQYTIMDNGQVFINADKEGFVDGLKKLGKDQVKQVFNSYDQMNFDQMNFNNPGNLYHFITMKSNGTTHKLTWGDKETKAPNELEVFHNILMNLVQAKKEGSTNQIKIN